MALSPDGNWVISIPLEGDPRLVLLPTGAGSPRELRHSGVEAYHWADWFPDGKSIFFAANMPGEGVRGFVRELDAEATRPITEPGITVFWKPIAPDGSSLVLLGGDGKLAIYPTEGGVPEPLPDILPGERPVRWSSDGEAIFLVRGDPLPLQVDRYEVRSGRRQPWRTITPADPVGLVDVPRLVMTGDGAGHAYSHTRLLSVLYVVSGLR
jgi:Tol biopolymer transport system component